MENSAIDRRIHSEIRTWASARGVAFDAVVLDSAEPSDQIKAMKGYDALIIGTEPFTAEVIAQLSGDLKAVVRFGVGYDSVDIDAATRHAIPVANTPGANSASVAEHALALILALSKKLIRNDGNLRAGVWTEPVGADVAGKTVGLIGFGAVSRTLAKLLAGFGCRLLAYDPYFDAEAAVALGVERSTIEEIVSIADVVSLHLPLNDETRHLVDAAFLAGMKADAVLINTSRGAIVDEDALVGYLRDNRIGGAGLDVFESEPLGPDSPLVGLANVVVTPHIAASTYEAAIRTYKMAIDTVTRIVGGQPCEHVLNR